MTGQLGLLQGEIGSAREAYDEAHRGLVVSLSGIFADGAQAADRLLGIAEEFGADQAVLRLLEHAEGIAPLHPQAIESQVADAADTVEQALERVLVAQDRLDLAMAARERALLQREPGRAQVIHIGGREFVIDTLKRELRSVDVPTERYELAGEVGQDRVKEKGSAMTLTEAVAREVGSDLAKPGPGGERTRGRE